jgi:DNA-binding NarL/FixJ family response regulator
MATTSSKKPARGAKSRVLLVEDHALVRQGLTQLLNQQADLSVCGESDRGEGVLKLIDSLRPDAVVVDLTLGDMSGVDLIKEISTKHAGLPILVLSMHQDSLYAERALRAGARGYVMKEEASETVVAALRKILGGEIHLGERAKARLLHKLVKSPLGQVDRTSMLERLSDRELEVFRLLGQGYSTRRIAERFNRSIKTVEIYRANIKHKLDLKDAAELIHFAVQYAQDPKPTRS